MAFREEWGSRSVGIRTNIGKQSIIIAPAAITTITSCTEVVILKLSIYIAGGFIALALAVLVITRGQVADTHPGMLLALVGLFGIPPFGAFWMMYMSIRHEKSPLPMILLAFIPFTFLWYYFERVRRGKVSKNA